MPDQALPDHVHKQPKGFSVQRWILATTIATVLFLLGAWLVLRYAGRDLLPKKHHDYHPHAALVLPSSSRLA